MSRREQLFAAHASLTFFGPTWGNSEASHLPSARQFSMLSRLGSVS